MKSIKTFTIALLLSAATLWSGVAAPSASANVVRPRATTAAAHRRSTGPNYGWQMFAATNASRRRYGLPGLIRGRSSSRVALAHSRRMANANSLYHSTQITPYLVGAGRVYMWGENIGWTTGGIPDLERAFMASPDHRPHILSSTFHHVGVGAVRRGNRLWVTLFFYN